MGRRQTFAEALERNVDRSGGPDACWLWMAGRVKGYGQTSSGPTRKYAHHAALELALGRSLADGHIACHTCDNPPCCNPAHLRLGSTSDNQRDCVSRGRRPSRKGMRHPLAKLTASDVQEIRRRRRAGERGKDLAHEFGVSAPTITGITRHADKHWSHV